MSDTYAYAIRYLTRREHSVFELRQKLIKTGFSEEEIEATLAKLIELDLQSDVRFTESFIRYRQGQGRGPVRIKQELLERGIHGELIRDQLNEQDENWFDIAKRVFEKKFKGKPFQDFKEKAKAMRFLHYAGFTYDQIRRII